MEVAHTKESGEVLSYFGVTEEIGLSPEQVKKNLDKYGFNGEGEKEKKWMDGWMEHWRVDEKSKSRRRNKRVISLDLVWKREWRAQIAVTLFVYGRDTVYLRGVAR